LKEHGHIVRIGTHKEFGPWIESHGLEFQETSGNPAELLVFIYLFIWISFFNYL